MADVGQCQIRREPGKSQNVFEDDYPTITVTAIVAETYGRNEVNSLAFWMARHRHYRPLLPLLRAV